MAEGDGHRSPLHLVQKYRRRSNVIEDLYLAVSCFVLLADVSLEAGPCLGTRDERFEPGEELAAVANAIRLLAMPFTDDGWNHWASINRTRSKSSPCFQGLSHKSTNSLKRQERNFGHSPQREGILPGKEVREMLP